ncbi:DUF4397 domain-containing protein [Mucilaginibacter glaciei]|uniref:DUF4397 domain-containing protein n=1 Tax=Mucilaginibacter glaciei TaxID=2772109 RepID=A0A926P032_9SPHI|nr:DUF4397 domain-containing protein [Mucilaginibacter glaciei]MBD1394849.1 DUF4397 domain-containing protein [Mucilaginibacter glaciei]
MNMKLPVLVVVLLAVALASCKKTDDAPTVVQTTNLNVVNAFTDTLNYYVNGTRVNVSSSLYPLGSSGYIGVAVGQQNYDFKRPLSPVVLFNRSLALDSGKTYTLYVAGRSTDLTFTTLDTLQADTANRARIRFVNAAPDAGNLDVMVGDTVKFKVRAFKTATVFLPVNAGLKRIRVYQSGSTIAKIDETRTLIAGRVYTLFTKGKLNGAGDAVLGTGLVVNR